MESILSFVGGDTVNCSLSIFGLYCKGAVNKKATKFGGVIVGSAVELLSSN